MKEPSSQEKAGRARADSMTASERKSLASKAAHARWKKDAEDVGTATHEGEWNGLSCAVLQDGRRVFSERSLSAAFEHTRSGGEYKRRREVPEAERLPVFVPTGVAQFLSDSARAKLSQPIRYRHTDGFSVPAWGIEAELLPELCDAFLEARQAQALTDAAGLRRAAAAERLLRGIAKVGIVALVDEVTGYQVERDKDELRRLLEKYVKEELRPYTSMFPTEFYSQIFRLRKITTADVRKRPSYFGKLTNDIVYSRMLPGMLERLKEVNPANGTTGRRLRRHHQHLTEDIGVQHLREHLAGVVFLMRAAGDWKSFKRSLDRSAPRRGDTLPLPFPSDEEE